MEKTIQIPKANKIKNLTVFQILMCVILSIYTLSIIVPLIIALNCSLSPDTQLTRIGYLNPFWNHIYNNEGVSINIFEMEKWTSVFEQYRMVIDGFNKQKAFNGIYYVNGVKYGREGIKVGFLGMFLNTFGYALGGSLVHSICMVLMSYLCAKYRNFFSKVIYGIVMFMMMVPILGSTSSTIELIRKIHLYDTYYGFLFFKFTFSGVYFLTYHAFFESLPDAYNEAAEIDGASQLRIMVTIIMPLASKLILTTTLLSFVAMYNEYTTALLYMPTHPTLAYGVYTLSLSSESSLSNGVRYTPTAVSARMAAIMILAIPMVTLFIFAKDKLMGNVSVGGIKG